MAFQSHFYELDLHLLNCPGSLSANGRMRIIFSTRYPDLIQYKFVAMEPVILAHNLYKSDENKKLAVMFEN